MNAEVVAGFDFGADIDVGCWIIANEDHGESWGDAMGKECGGFVTAFFEDLGGYGFSINEIHVSRELLWLWALGKDVLAIFAD